MTVSPRALGANTRVTARAGLGTVLVDLRRTALPVSGPVTLRIEGGRSAHDRRTATR